MFVLDSSQVKMEAKVNSEIITLNLQNLQTRTPLLCCDCNRQIKGKLEDENKKKHIFMYVQQVDVMKNKQPVKQKAYFVTVV